MIIGNGLLANAFQEANNPIFNDWVVFASGVSNSNELDSYYFKKEKDLLIKTLRENNGLNFIYFSSVLVGISDKPYYKHKLEMENIIKKEHNNYIIFRLPQIIGPNGNPNTLFNYLQNKIKTNQSIVIYHNAERALVEASDLVNLVIYTTDKVMGETIIFSHIEKISVLELYNKINKKLNIEPIINKRIITANDNFSGNWEIDNSKIVTDWLADKNLIGYTDKIIEKYIIK